jgi:hypothetical protein
VGRIQKNDNFIDKTFTIIADVLLRVFPASQQEKKLMLKATFDDEETMNKA